MEKSQTKKLNRIRRHNRIRAHIVGTDVRPRLSVYKSNRFLHVQLINDESGKTLLSGSTKGMKEKKTGAARALGLDLAKRAQSAGIKAVVFDRGGFRYTGRVAELAKAVREGGVTM